MTYYTQSTVCQRGFYERISSNEFISQFMGVCRICQGGGGELHVGKRLLGDSGACFPEKMFLYGLILCVLEHIILNFLL